MMNTGNKVSSCRRLNKRQERYFQDQNLGTMLIRPVNRLVHPYTWAGHILFAFILTRIMKPNVFVELGTHSGNSFCAFCQAIKEERLKTKSYAIDTWEGDDQAGYYGEAVYEDLSQYVSTTYGSFAKLLRMAFNEGLDYFDNNSIDLLHIDGLHTYEAVRHDFEVWKNKMTTSGVVLFHDTQVFERGFGVHRLWDELRESYKGFEFLHSHGLGILLIGKHVSPDLVEFINLAVENPSPIQLSFEKASKVWLPEEAQEYQRRFTIEPQEETFHLFCELFLNLGKGFNDSNKIISYIRIKYRKGIAVYELQRFSDNLSGLRFDPGDDVICLGKIAAWGFNVEHGWGKLNIIRSSAIRKNSDEILFGSDPWIEFDIPSYRIEKIKIELQVKAIGTELVEIIAGLVENSANLQAELGENMALVEKLLSDLKEKDRMSAQQEAMTKKLWNDLTEKDRMLAQQEAMAKKLWSDLAEKDRLLEKRKA